MGIVIPRPQMRNKERRRIEARIARHSELMREFEAKGLPRQQASAEAMAALKSEEQARAKARTRKGTTMSYRVVYGESRPAWEKTFPTMREAKAFAKEHESFGDVIFSIARVVPGEPPQSLSAAIAAAQ